MGSFDLVDVRDPSSPVRVAAVKWKVDGQANSLDLTVLDQRYIAEIHPDQAEPVGPIGSVELIVAG